MKRDNYLCDLLILQLLNQNVTPITPFRGPQKNRSATKNHKLRSNNLTWYKNTNTQHHSQTPKLLLEQIIECSRGPHK